MFLLTHGRKHKLRHVKPFHCDVPNCMRAKEGFGTKNDLDRHKKSVHSDSSVAGARYVCRLEQCGIKDPAKKWPRADNFRSHLQRVHKVVLKSDDNMDEYIYRYVASAQNCPQFFSYIFSDNLKIAFLRVRTFKALAPILQVSPAPSTSSQRARFRSIRLSPKPMCLILNQEATFGTCNNLSTPYSLEIQRTLDPT